MRDLKRGMVVIDENKVALMTKLAIYEKHESGRNLVMSKYYEGDYVRYNVLKTWVAATVAYWIIIAAYIFMSFDDLLAKVNDIDYFDLMYKILGAYAAFCIVYYLISSVIYRYRYIKAKKGLVEYNSNLRDLIELEGGPMHRGKVAKGTRVNMTSSQNKSGEANAAKPKTRVNRSEIVKQREAAEEKRKEAEIIENVKKRNERIAIQNEEKLRQQRQAEADRKRIQERRKQLEREQMEKLRNERMQQMQRQNHTYNNTGNNEGSNR